MSAKLCKGRGVGGGREPCWVTDGGLGLRCSFAHPPCLPVGYRERVSQGLIPRTPDSLVARPPPRPSPVTWPAAGCSIHCSVHFPSLRPVAFWEVGDKLDEWPFCFLPPPRSAWPGESDCRPKDLLAAKDTAWEDPAWVEGDVWFSEQEGLGNWVWHLARPTAQAARRGAWPAPRLGSSRPAPHQGPGRGQKWARRGVEGVWEQTACG